MSLDTFSHLKTAIAALLVRTDLTADIPDFITLAEAQMNRLLDCRQMTEITTLSLSSESYSLPCDFAGVKSFRLNTSPVRKLEYRDPEEFDDVSDDASFGAGAPLYYTISGSRFYFSPTPDGAYQARLRYRQSIPPLGMQTPCNWLLESHPDAYLYGACLQAAPRLQEDERIAVWSGFFLTAIADINTDDSRQNTAAHPAMRVKRIG